MTSLGVVTLETDLGDALSLGARALAYAEAERLPLLLSAACRAEALVLGALQREDTLRGRSNARFDDVRRRATTGTEAQLAGDVLYHALALPRVDALFADASPRTLLNRNLRAILRGYAAAGVPLRYFGTEVLALLGHPVALVGYDQTASGGVLIEVFVGLEQPCVVRPALRREPPAALYDVLRSTPRLLEPVAHGIVERLGATVVPLTLPTGSLPLVTFSTGAVNSVAIPLGVVEVTLQGALEISGDLLVSRAALERVAQEAQAAVDAGRAPDQAVLAALQGVPLDGARPADVLAALASARSMAPRTP